ISLNGEPLETVLNQQTLQSKNLLNNIYLINKDGGNIMPFNPKQESEADQMGLVFMAIAGYNPERALTTWQHISDMKSSASDFLLLHPYNAIRKAQLNKQIN